MSIFGRHCKDFWSHVMKHSQHSRLAFDHRSWWGRPELRAAVQVGASVHRVHVGLQDIEGSCLLLQQRWTVPISCSNGLEFAFPCFLNCFLSSCQRLGLYAIKCIARSTCESVVHCKLLASTLHRVDFLSLVCGLLQRLGNDAWLRRSTQVGHMRAFPPSR